MTVSSAESSTFNATLSETSSIYNKTGPRTEPCGIPTGEVYDDLPPTSFCLQSVRKSLICATTALFEI